MALLHKEKLIECIYHELENGGTILLLTKNIVVSEISYIGNTYKYFTFNDNHDLISKEDLKGATSKNIAKMIYNWIIKNPQNNKIWSGEPRTQIYFENDLYHTNYNHKCIKDFGMFQLQSVLISLMIVAFGVLNAHPFTHLPTLCRPIYSNKLDIFAIKIVKNLIG